MIPFFTSRTTCQILNYACSIDVHFIFYVCKLLRVKCQKLAKTLSKIHIDREVATLDKIFSVTNSNALLNIICTLRYSVTNTKC